MNEAFIWWVVLSVAFCLTTTFFGSQAGHEMKGGESRGAVYGLAFGVAAVFVAFVGSTLFAILLGGTL